MLFLNGLIIKIMKEDLIINMKTPELLSPVSNWTSLNAAIDAGADAVYFGLKELNMRITAENFKLEELKDVAELCYKKKVKTYLTLNTIIYSNEIKRLKEILKEAKGKVDAVICWDLAVINECKKLKIPIHLSTQASVANVEAAKFYKKLGVERIVLARELNIEQIKEIKKVIEVEIFVHGAMCVSISGRCFLSQETFKRSANRGDCLQNCRREYLIKDSEEGHEFLLGKNYILSAKDLCMLPYLDKLMFVDSFKIEGRARTPEYVYIVTKAYREAIDVIKAKRFNKNLVNKLVQDLDKVYHREFSSGFYFENPGFASPENVAEEYKEYVGKVINFYKNNNVAEIVLESGTLKLNDKILIEGNKTGVFYQNIKDMEVNKKKIKGIKKGERVGIKMNNICRENDRVYLIKKRN